jgi:AraC family transcriptional regulator of adaptative response/methylated-DNA-[protein]-cysteine methyltransferase
MGANPQIAIDGMAYAARRKMIDTPLGAMIAVADDRGLMLCEYARRPMLPKQFDRIRAFCGGAIEEGDHPIIEQTQKELDEYFLGQREVFTIPLLLGGTPFQSAVWHELLKIPFGKTTSYDSIAIKLGRLNGQRAVGRANGDNRIAIIVPCHRVINADGSLSGYGGGRDKKRWLLNHERRGVQLDLPM